MGTDSLWAGAETGASKWLIQNRPLVTLEVFGFLHTGISLTARQAKTPNGRGDLNASTGLYCCLQCPSPGTSHEMAWLWLDHKWSGDADAKGRIWMADSFKIKYLYQEDSDLIAPKAAFSLEGFLSLDFSQSTTLIWFQMPKCRNFFQSFILNT